MTTCSEEDRLADPNFDPVALVNELLPTRESLVQAEDVSVRFRAMAEAHEAEIVELVRQESSVSCDVSATLEAAKTSMGDLQSRVESTIKRAAEHQEMVQGLYADMQTLDHAHKRITYTLEVLEDLKAAVEVTEDVEKKVAGANWAALTAPLRDSQKLVKALAPLSSIPQVQEALENLENVREIAGRKLMLQFERVDFNTLDVDLDTNGEGSHAMGVCSALSALGGEGEETCVRYLLRNLMAPYSNLFGPEKEGFSLAFGTRRFVWMKRLSRGLGERGVLNMLPSSWNVGKKLMEMFATSTGEHVAQILDAWDETATSEVPTMLEVLQKTLEWEENVAQRYPDDPEKAVDIFDDDGSLPGEEDDGRELMTAHEVREESAADRVRKKYQMLRASEARKKAAQKRHGGEPREAVEAAPSKFRGIISRSFEPYLEYYVRMEEENLRELLNSAVQNETWEPEPPFDALGSANDLFFAYKASLARVVPLTTKQTLFSLFKLFVRNLELYCSTLERRLPGSNTALSAEELDGADAEDKARTWREKFPSPVMEDGATGELTMDEFDVNEICAVANTADHCSSTLFDLMEAVKRKIDPVYREGVVAEDLEMRFARLKSQALQSLSVSVTSPLVKGIRNAFREWDMSVEMVAGAPSVYATNVESLLSSVVPHAHQNLSRRSFRNFCQRTGLELWEDAYHAIMECARPEPGSGVRAAAFGGVEGSLAPGPGKGAVAQQAAAQLMVDFRTIGHALHILPILGLGSNGEDVSVPRTYARMTEEQHSHVDHVLKTLSAPDALTVVATHRTLIPGRTTEADCELVQILMLRGFTPPGELEEAMEHVKMRAGSHSQEPSSSVSPAPVEDTMSSRIRGALQDYRQRAK